MVFYDYYLLAEFGLKRNIIIRMFINPAKMNKNNNIFFISGIEKNQLRTTI